MEIVELSPVPDAWQVARQLAGLPHLLFLDSADRDSPSGQNRYSFVAADPVCWLSGRSDDQRPVTFSLLAQLLERFHAPTHPDLPPFQGGLAGLFGYELAHLTERLPRPKWDDFHMPDLGVGLYDWVVAFDHRDNRTWIISTGVTPEFPRGSPKQAQERLQRVQTLLTAHGKRPSVSQKPDEASPVSSLMHPLASHPEVYSNFTRPDFEAAVARVIEYIRAGDVFQVNLSQRLLARSTIDPLELYGRLRECNPAPFAGYLDLGEFAVASASPERFLKVDSRGQVETRPIKGTRPRALDPILDAAHQAELLASEKDRAENIMIVDLLRNDLGKVCEYGSIRPTKVCELESFRTVHHLVSEVVGRLAKGKTSLDLLQAAFPGGSITGAPKVRAMQIIAELEPTVRGPYCGSMGYLGFDGSMDSNILIRTFTLGGGWAQFPVGAGIVADSDSAAEYEETLAKAAGLLRALK